MGVHLQVDSLVFLPLIHHLHDHPSVEAEKPQRTALPRLMTASSPFCVPVNNKAIENIVFNKCSTQFWSEDSAKKIQKDLIFS